MIDCAAFRPSSSCAPGRGADDDAMADTRQALMTVTKAGLLGEGLPELEFPPTEAGLVNSRRDCYFNARLLQYHETSLVLQPVISPASVHSA